MNWNSSDCPVIHFDQVQYTSDQPGGPGGYFSARLAKYISEVYLSVLNYNMGCRYFISSVSITSILQIYQFHFVIVLISPHSCLSHTKNILSHATRTSRFVLPRLQLPFLFITSLLPFHSPFHLNTLSKLVVFIHSLKLIPG